MKHFQGLTKLKKINTWVKVPPIGSKEWYRDAKRTAKYLMHNLKK